MLHEVYFYLYFIFFEVHVAFIILLSTTLLHAQLNLSNIRRLVDAICIQSTFEKTEEDYGADVTGKVLRQIGVGMKMSTKLNGTSTTDLFTVSSDNGKQKSKSPDIRISSPLKGSPMPSIAFAFCRE